MVTVITGVNVVNSCTLSGFIFILLVFLKPGFWRHLWSLMVLTRQTTSNTMRYLCVHNKLTMLVHIHCNDD